MSVISPLSLGFKSCEKQNMDKIEAILGNMASNVSRQTTQMVQKAAQSAQNYFHPLCQIESSYAQCDNLATPLTMHFLVTLF